MQHFFLKNAMQYAGYLWNEIVGICQNVQELAETVGAGKKNKKSESAGHV